MITQPDPDRQEDAHRWPQALPGGKAVLFTAGSAGSFFEATTIEVQSFETGERNTLLKGGVSGRYLPSGHLIYLRSGTLFAAPMDAAGLRLTGPAVPVLADVAGHAGSGGGHFSFSETGVFLYTQSAVDTSRWLLSWVTQSGQLEPLITEPGRYYTPRVSPDGRRLALSIAKGTEQNIWIYDLDRATMSRLTFDRGPDTYPVWFPDGVHVAYRSGRNPQLGASMSRAPMGAESRNGSLTAPHQSPIRFPGMAAFSSIAKHCRGRIGTSGRRLWRCAVLADLKRVSQAFFSKPNLVSFWLSTLL